MLFWPALAGLTLTLCFLNLGRIDDKFFDFLPDFASPGPAKAGIDRAKPCEAVVDRLPDA